MTVEDKGGAPAAPDEPLNEGESKSDGKTSNDKTEAPETEGENSPTPDDDKSEGEASAERSEGDDASKEQEETKNQRKKRLKRERFERVQAELAEAQKRLSKYEKPSNSLAEQDPAKADNYEEAIAHNAAARLLKAQREGERKDAADSVADLRKQAQEAAMEAWQERVENEARHIKDFDAKVNSADVPWTGPLVEFIAEMEKGPELAYHLAVNRHEILRIKDLPPTKMAAELSKLERSLSYPKPKTKTTAPPPINPIKGAATAPEPDLDKIPYADYRRVRGFD